MLHLVDDHQAPKVAEGQHRVLELGELEWVLEVESLGDASAPVDDLPREGRFAHLPRADQANDRKALQQMFDTLNVAGSLDHPGILP